MSQTRTKYWLLSVFGALVAVFGVLALTTTPAQAQVDPAEPTITKECSPNPVQVGEQLTCTIDVVAAPNTLAFIQFTDTLPAGLSVTGATSELLVNGLPLVAIPCTVDGNTVTCPSEPNSFAPVQNVADTNLSYRATIEARAEQCGSFQNTATVTGFIEPGNIPFTAEDTADITVEGCPTPSPPPGAAGGGGPITQESEQESEAGEIDQSFEVS